MTGKKILAGVFAVVILLKLLALLVSPDRWLGLATALLGHSAVVVGIYLVLIVITGYYVFSSIDLIDLAVAKSPRVWANWPQQVWFSGYS